MAGVRVALLHPGWDRPCSLCEAFRTRDDGSFATDRRTALLVIRLPTEPTPCHKCPKVPAAVRQLGLDTPDLRKHAADLTDANRKALAFYERCRATGRFPDDPVVSWYAGLIRSAENAAAAGRVDRTAEAVEALLVVLAPRRR